MYCTIPVCLPNFGNVCIVIHVFEIAEFPKKWLSFYFNIIYYFICITIITKNDLNTFWLLHNRKTFWNIVSCYRIKYNVEKNSKIILQKLYKKVIINYIIALTSLDRIYMHNSKCDLKWKRAVYKNT